MKSSLWNEQPLSVFTLGTAQLGMRYGIANTSGIIGHETRQAVLKTAVKNGVNVLDTAYSYGDAQKEVGIFLADCAPAERPLIVSKCSGLTCDMDEQAVYDWLMHVAEKSLADLAIDSIPMMLLHSVQELQTGGEAARTALFDMKKKGMIGTAGISMYAEDDVMHLLEDPLFDVYQIPMNVFDLRLWKNGVLDAMKQKGKAVFVRSIYLQGLCLMSDQVVAQKMPKARPYVQKLQAFAKKIDRPVAEICVCLIRDLEAVTSLVIGCDHEQQVLQNVQWMNAPALNKNDVENMKDFFNDIPDWILDPRTWNQRN